ncbi:MAG: hypothetical protein EP343_29700 [Deltaproteobacteria bacterium]|nr:MAG: hypothetical protein EP343_29700 [Deltaproteobacteria bacterium]
MEIRIISAHSAIAYPIAVHLEEALSATVHLSSSHVNRYELAHRAGLPMQKVSQLLAMLQPLSPIVRMNPALTDADFELYLGDNNTLDNWNISVHADNEELCSEFVTKLESSGFSCNNSSTGYQQESKMLFGGASAFARQAIQWFAKQYNVSLSERKDWSEEDNDIWIYLRHPKHDQFPPRECFDVQVHTDSPESAISLRDVLLDAGFSQASSSPSDSFLSLNRFQIEAGPFAQSESQSDLRQLEFMCRTFLEQAGVDLERYPLHINTDSSDSLQAKIFLPLRQWKEGNLLPYAGPYPDRFELFIQTDAPERLEALTTQCRELGLAGVSVQTIRESDPPTGFEMTWGAAEEVPHITSQLEQFTREFLSEELEDDDWELYVNRRPDEEEWSHKIQISLPIRRAESGSLTDAILSHARHFDLAIYSQEMDRLNPLLDELRGMGFKTFDTNSECHEDTPLIRYGGALPALLEHLRQRFQPFVESEISLQKAWDDSDDDIWVYLPRSSVRPEEPTMSLQHRPDLQEWLAPNGEITHVDSPLVSIQQDTVQIADMTLHRRPHHDSNLAPETSLFQHYCIDTITAETLSFIATSVAMREPCLLEGETSTSKTSAVLYLASLLNQPIVRLNLNGQTDTSELIGRFVPDTDTSTQGSHKTADSLDGLPAAPASESKSSGQRSPWRWQDGLIVQAMRKGWWVLLDEVNLAEPQILERLNSVLEQTPSLILTEYDNAVLGPGGEPVHPDFRLFATMNPAEYEGRSTLSPAYRDRWRAYRFVTPPSETEYLHMLHLLVYGQQPDVTLMGQTYKGGETTAPYSMLADIPMLGSFLDALARFHASLEHAVRPQGSSGPRLGNRRRERYIFTRRGLLSFIDFLANLVPGNSSPTTRILRIALYRYYLARIADPNDQMVVIQLLDAVGIGPNQWMFSGQQCDLVLVDIGPNSEELLEKAAALFEEEDPEQVEELLSQPQITLYRDISLEEAQELRREWEALGATVDLQPHLQEEDEDED